MGGCRGDCEAGVWDRPHKHTHSLPSCLYGAHIPGPQWTLPRPSRHQEAGLHWGFLSVPLFLRCPLRSPPSFPALLPSFALGLEAAWFCGGNLENRGTLGGSWSPSLYNAHLLLYPGLVQIETATNGLFCVDKPPTSMVAVAVAGPQVRGGVPKHRALTWIPSFPFLKPGPRPVTKECFVPA